MKWFASRHKMELSPHRIEALTDGVFAIAMTILVLNLEVAEPINKELFAKLHENLVSLWPRFIHYIESFFILGAFWFKHHQFSHYIKKMDHRLVWLNLLSLLFICLIPFSTSVAGDYAGHRSSALIFEINILLTGLTYYLQWTHAYKQKLITQELDIKVINYFKEGTLIIPIVALIAITISVFKPFWGTVPFLLIPLIMFTYKK